MTSNSKSVMISSRIGLQYEGLPIRIIMLGRERDI
jgi:hypothetical protein